MRIGFLVGLGIVILLVGWQGFAAIAEPLADAGWGILLVALFIPPDLLLRAASLQLLFVPGRPPRFRDTAFAMWVGSSVNFLLPVATVGGEFVKARMLNLRGVPGADAAAVVVVDKTVQAMSVLLWALAGIALLALTVPAERPTVMAALGGAGLMAVGILGFVVVQRVGIFGLLSRPAARLSRKGAWQSLAESATDVDGVIRTLYRRRGAIAASTFLRVLKRVVMAGEVWFVTWLFGHPLGIAEVVILNSLAVALRSAAFGIPGGLGAQEGGYVIGGALLGLPPGVMLATSLATRLGELIEGLPGLLAWQVAEGRAYRGRRTTSSSSSSTPPPTP